MSVPWTVFTTIGNLIITPFTGVTSAETALITALQPILIAALTINIMWHGYETIRGKGGPNAFLDVWALALRPGLVFALGLVAYTTNVTGLIDSMIGYLSSLLATPGSLTAATGGSAAGGGSLAGTLGVLDTATSSALTSLETIWDIATGSQPGCSIAGVSPCVDHITLNLLSNAPADFTGIMMITQGFLMVVAFMLYAMFAAFELLYINIALLIFYALGPLFVAAYAFRSTEHFFSSWLKGAAQYGLTAVIIAATIGIANTILMSFVNSIATNLATSDLFMVGLAALAAAAMLILLIYKVPELAGHIIGGFNLQSSASTVGQIKNAVQQNLDRAQSKADRIVNQKAAAANELKQEERHKELVGALGSGSTNGAPSANQIANSIQSAQSGGTGNVTGSTRPIQPPFVAL